MHLKVSSARHLVLVGDIHILSGLQMPLATTTACYGLERREKVDVRGVRESQVSESVSSMDGEECFSRNLYIVLG